jgi:hypothetical protein
VSTVEQLSSIRKFRKSGPQWTEQPIARAISPSSAWIGNFVGGTPSEFVNVNIKVLWLGPTLQITGPGFDGTDDSHVSGVKPPNIFAFVHRMSVSVFVRPAAVKVAGRNPSRLPRQRMVDF